MSGTATGRKEGQKQTSISSTMISPPKVAIEQRQTIPVLVKTMNDNNLLMFSCIIHEIMKPFATRL